MSDESTLEICCNLFLELAKLAQLPDLRENPEIKHTHEFSKQQQTAFTVLRTPLVRASFHCTIRVSGFATCKLGRNLCISSMNYALICCTACMVIQQSAFLQRVVATLEINK